MGKSVFYSCVRNHVGTITINSIQPQCQKIEQFFDCLNYLCSVLYYFYATVLVAAVERT